MPDGQNGDPGDGTGAPVPVQTPAPAAAPARTVTPYERIFNQLQDNAALHRTESTAMIAGFNRMEKALEKLATQGGCRMPANPPPAQAQPAEGSNITETEVQAYIEKEAERLSEIAKAEKAAKTKPKSGLSWFSRNSVLIVVLVIGAAAVTWAIIKTNETEAWKQTKFNEASNAGADYRKKLEAELEAAKLAAPTPAANVPNQQIESVVVTKELPPVQNNMMYKGVEEYDNFHRDRCPSGNCGDNRSYSPPPIDVEPESIHRESPEGPVGKWPYVLVEREYGGLNLLRYVDCVKAPDGCYVIQIRGGKYTDPDNAGVVRTTYLRAPLPGVGDTDKVRMFGPLR